MNYDLEALQTEYARALDRRFDGDTNKMLQFMCQNIWNKALKDRGQSYLAFGPYWWAVKDIIERTIGPQWGETQAVNPWLRNNYRVKEGNSDALTLMLADEYRMIRLAQFGVSPHHDLSLEHDDDDEYTLEDSDMFQYHT